MERIKSYLIHLLGGVTKQELAREKAPTYLFWHFCMLNRINSIKQKADSLYGTPPEEWCRKVYKYITDEIDNITDEIDNMEKLPKKSEGRKSISDYQFRKGRL